MDINRLDVVDSTNEEAKRIIKNDHNSEEFIIIAKEQTNGRGKRNRIFISDKGQGIYMSIALKIKNFFALDKLMMNITAVVTQCLEIFFEISLKIKWVNDIFFEGKKIGGILIEEIDNFIVIGIGINIAIDRSKISKIFEEKFSYIVVKSEEKLKNIENYLIAEIANINNDSNLLSFYKSRSLVINKSIILKMGDEMKAMKVHDISENGHLVGMIDGRNRIISSGDIIKVYI